MTYSLLDLAADRLLLAVEVERQGDLACAAELRIGASVAEFQALDQEAEGEERAIARAFSRAVRSALRA